MINIFQPALLCISNLPLPPVGVNHQYRPRATPARVAAPPTGVMSLSDYRQAAAKASVSGGRVLTEVMQEYRDAVLALLNLEYGHPPMFDTKPIPDLAVWMTFHVRRSQFYRRDADGMVKFPLDILCQWMGINDARVTKLTVEKRPVLTAGEERLDYSIMTTGQTVPPMPRGRGRTKGKAA